MSNKLVWSNTMTRDYFLGLSPEALRSELVDYGYDEEMLAGLSEDELRNIVLEDADDVFWPQDSEDFEYNVAPAISAQTKGGIVLMSGSAHNWTGNHGAGKAAYADELVGGDICRSCDKVDIKDADGQLYWLGYNHDGRIEMALYALPEDEAKIREFIQVCCPDAIGEETMVGEEGQTDEESLDNLVQDFMNNYYDTDWLDNWCDFSKVPEVCEPIRNTITEALEEPITEKKSVVDKAKVDRWAPTTEAFEEQPIQEDRSNKLAMLADEFEEIKADYEDFGPAGFYAVPFSSFKKEFPVFAKRIILSYLKSLDAPELEDEANFEEAWAAGELIWPDDWDILFDATEALLAGDDVMWANTIKKYSKYTTESVEKEENICSICNQPYKGFGNNAWPVAEGKCCDKCNMSVVIPERIRGLR